MALEAAIAREPGDRDRVALADFVLRLRRNGITDRKVLAAFEAVPRRLFVPHEVQDEAYVERALPIECGQTMLAPEIVGIMAASLEAAPSNRVLEIGTGSGYLTAVLSHLVQNVYSLDRYRTLVEAAQSRFRTLKRANVTAMVGDGTLGWPANASFDRIVVTAAAPAIPKPLLDQLKPDGIMVIPIGSPDEIQGLFQIRRGADGLANTRITDVRIVSLVPGKAALL